MAARKTTAPTVRRARAADLRRWWRRKTRRARKSIACKLHLTTSTTKKTRPTRPPQQAIPGTAPQLHTLTGKPVPQPRKTVVPPQTSGKAAPMSQRVKRSKGGKFNGSTASKKTVAPNPEQRRLLAANKKAAQIDARLARTEQRIDRMFPDRGSQS